METVKPNFFRTQSVKANVVQTTRAMASTFWMRSVRAFAILTKPCLTDAVWQGK